MVKGRAGASSFAARGLPPTLMAVNTDPTPPPPSRRSLGRWLADMPRWKKVAVLAALGAAAVGGALTLIAAPATTTGGSGSGLATSLVAGQPPAGGTTQAPEEPVAKGVFRLGFSFLAGFCLGSFLRATLRIAAIAFGFWLLATMLLAHYGIVVVDWNALSAAWDRFTANVEQEWGSVQRFLTGSLPAAGLAATGLVVGLRRH